MHTIKLLTPLLGAAATLTLFASPAHAQEDPLKGSWFVRGEDDRGPYEGTLKFDLIDSGRYRARAKLSSKDGSVDRSYDAPATLTSSTLTIRRPVSTGIVGAIDGQVIATGLVTADKLRIRGGSNTSHQILGSFDRGARVDILAREGDFYRIKRPGVPAYVSAMYVKLDPAVDSAWVGTFLGGGAGYNGTWIKDQRILGNESLARISEGALNFAAIDLTSDMDARDLVGRFRGYGWNNLIDKVPNLKDDAHPDMSLQSGIVSPYGKLRDISAHQSICDLPSSVAIKNIATAREWLPTAGVRLSADKTRGQLLGGTETTDGEVSFANFLFVSSHGYPSGKIKYTPSFTDFSWFDGTILDVHDLGLGKRWRNGQTRWLMLALCNVLREEHWEDWAKALRDDSGLRGVLGYFRAAPGPAGTRIINDRFFEASRQGKSILDAWKYANYEVSNKEGVLTWCALVREDATTDSLDAWTRDKKLPDGRPGARVLYFSTLPAEKQGIPVARTEGDVLPATIAWVNSGRPVTPAEVSRGGGLVPGAQYDLQFSIGRPLAQGEKVEVTFVNVRETYWEQHGELDAFKMFDVSEPSGISERKGVFPPTATHVDTITLDRLKLSLTARIDLLNHIHENEAEIWVKVQVLSADGSVVARGSSITAPLIARRHGTEPHGP